MKNYSFKLFLIALSIVAFSSCKGTKKIAEAATKAYSPAGTWEYMITGLPDGDQSGTMTLSKVAEGLTGKLLTENGEVDMEDLLISDNALTSTFSVQGYDVNMKGNFEGEKFTGSIDVAGYQFPITATRKP